jgi:hypothetical protein
MQSNSKGAIILVALLALVGSGYLYLRPTSSVSQKPSVSTEIKGNNTLPKSHITVGSNISLLAQDIISVEKNLQLATSTYTVVSVKEVEIPEKNTTSTLFEACAPTQTELLCGYFVTNSQGKYVELKHENNSPESYKDMPGSFAKLVGEKIPENDMGIATLSNNYFNGIAVSTSTYPHLFVVAHTVQGDTKSYEELVGYDPDTIINGKPSSQVLASTAHYATMGDGSIPDDYITLSETSAFGLRVGNSFRTVELRTDFATTTNSKMITISSYDNDDYTHKIVLLPQQSAPMSFQEEGRTNMYSLDDIVIFTTDKKQYSYSFKTNTLSTLPK